MRNPNRQEIYKTYDIIGSYEAIIRPKLKSLSITILDTIKADGLLSFKVKNKKYIIDKGQFKEKDGVILYTGIDEPIFWPNNECNNIEFIECYYKNKN